MFRLSTVVQMLPVKGEGWWFSLSGHGENTESRAKQSRPRLSVSFASGQFQRPDRTTKSRLEVCFLSAKPVHSQA